MSTGVNREQTTAASMQGTLQKSFKQKFKSGERVSLEGARRQGTPVSLNGEQQHNTSNCLQNSQLSANPYLVQS